MVNSIARERLFARLDASARRRIAWISGAAGAGKSTLAASYVQARGNRCLWYQLDAEDADIGSFFHFLAHAATRLDERRARELAAFQSGEIADIASFSRRFFRKLFSCAKLATMLVLDNLPPLAPEDRLALAVETAFEEVPQNWCIVVTSRAPPPARLARLQASETLVPIGGEELRFDAQELAAVAELRSLPLAAAALRRLENLTGGWAAGAVLIIEHAKLAGGLAELPDDATPEIVFDFLAGEIFERFDAATRNFLLRIAALGRMTAEIAAILSGEERAARILRNLAHNDYFVREARSEEGLVYQLHPLLQAFLRERGSEAEDAQAGVRMQQAAARMCATGQIEGAVTLLTECADWPAIAALVSEHARALVEQGRSEVLRNWLERLPRALVASDPRLLLASGLAAMRSSPRIARRSLEQAFRAFENTGESSGMTMSACAIMATVIEELDDLSALDPWIATAQQRLESMAEADVELLAVLVLAMLIRSPSHSELPKWMEAGRRVCASAAERATPGRARLALLLSLAPCLRGESGWTQSLHPPPLPDDATSRARLEHALACALASAIEGDLAAALASAHAALDAAATEGDHGLDVWLTAIVVYASLGLDDPVTAREALQRLEASPTRLRRAESAVVLWLSSQRALLEGDIGAAQRDARSALSISTEAGLPWLELCAQISLAQLAALAGDRHGAEASLRGATPLADALGNPSLNLALQLTAAEIAHEHRDQASTHAALSRGFALVRMHGLKHVPILRPGSLAELCLLALNAGIEIEYVRSLIRAGSLTPPQGALQVQDWPWQFRIHTLGRFDIVRHHASVQFASKGPGRPAELLKLLIAFGGESVRTEQLADALWPRVDADYAHKSFTITLHRLRRLLGSDEALILRDSRLRLNPKLFWVDLWALDHALASLEALLREPTPRPDALCSALHGIGDTYPGAFLAADEEQAQFIACRERVRARIARLLGRIMRRAAPPLVADALEAAYLRCIEADELCEAFHCGLMLCYANRGDRVEALATYERLRTLLNAKLGAQPSRETQVAYESIAAENRRAR